MEDRIAALIAELCEPLSREAYGDRDEGLFTGMGRFYTNECRKELAGEIERRFLLSADTGLKAYVDELRQTPRPREGIGLGGLVSIVRGTVSHKVADELERCCLTQSKE